MQSKISLQSFMKRYHSDTDRLFAMLTARMNGDNDCLTTDCDGKIDVHYRHLKSRKDDRSKKALICPLCLGHFHPLADGPFDHCKLPLELIFKITFDVLSSSAGTSAHEIKKRYGISYTTSHLFLHRIREHMGRCLPTYFENTVVEVDETYISTGNKGLHRHFPFKRGRGSEKNSTVVSIVERSGKCLILKVPDVQATTLLGLIEKHVNPNCKVFTDNLPAYRGLTRLGYRHEVVNHKSPDGTKRWVNGMASTNAAENSFSNLKRGLKGVYRSVSDDHIQNYLNEFAFKHTYRNSFDYGFGDFLKCMPPLQETYRLKNSA